MKHFTLEVQKGKKGRRIKKFFNSYPHLKPSSFLAVDLVLPYPSGISQSFNNANTNARHLTQSCTSFIF
jgi:hypothetical protein